MLAFAIEYRKAIEKITSDRRNDLQQFELSGEEWVIAEELRDILKVRDSMALAPAPCDRMVLYGAFMVDSKGRCRLLLAWHPESGDCDPRYGSHSHRLHQRLPTNKPKTSCSPDCH